jgi:hypothetical protein
MSKHQSSLFKLSRLVSENHPTHFPAFGMFLPSATQAGTFSANHSPIYFYAALSGGPSPDCRIGVAQEFENQ